MDRRTAAVCPRKPPFIVMNRPFAEFPRFTEFDERLLRMRPVPGGDGSAPQPGHRTTGPERTRMPDLLAFARRGRVIASLAGVLALAVALFATAATAGAGTTPPASSPTYSQPKPKPK